MSEHVVHTLIPFYPFGIDLSISTPVVFMFGTSIFIAAGLFCLNRSKRFQGILSFTFNFVSDSFASNLATKNKLWYSFLLTLFLFVFFSNLTGLLPNGEAPTSNINVTAALAVMIFVISHVCGFLIHGVSHIKHLVPAGIPKPMLLFFFPLEIISQLARPFSLSVRLFANMFAGHQVLTIFIGFVTIVPHIVLKVIPFGGVFLISMFEIFVSFIQSFIFTYLASFYISDAVSGSH